MTKFKNLKKTIINPKLLYTFPLASIGLLGTKQIANAMFNPPRNTPTVKHFNGASSTSTSRPLTSPTSPFTSRRPLYTSTSSNRPLSTPNTGASSQTSKSYPFKTSGSKVSSLVARFESLSSSSSDLKSGTKSSQKLDVSDKTSSSPSSPDSKPTPNPAENINLGAKSKIYATSLSSDSKKTTATSTEPLNPKNDISFIDGMINFKNSIKNLTSGGLTEELKPELNIIILNKMPSNRSTLNQSVDNVRSIANKLGNDTFKT